MATNCNQRGCLTNKKTRWKFKNPFFPKNCHLLKTYERQRSSNNNNNNQTVFQTTHNQNDLKTLVYNILKLCSPIYTYIYRDTRIKLPQQKKEQELKHKTSPEIKKMARISYSGVMMFIMMITISINVEKCEAGRILLQTTIPTIPGMPNFPTIPNFPAIPSFPTFPNMPTIPSIPGMPKVNLPPLPNMPSFAPPPSK